MIHTIELNGAWDEGYALDSYVEKSIFIDEDIFGNPRFDTTYTTIGKLLHDMKYNGHYDTSQEIAACCYEFLVEWLSNKNVNVIIPVPATTERTVQPVYAIAKAISKNLNISYAPDVLIKESNIPVKSIPKANRNLKGSIKKQKYASVKCNVLLIDDFYSTGATATECVSMLKEDEFVDKIYYLAIAKTKNK